LLKDLKRRSPSGLGSLTLVRGASTALKYPERSDDGLR